jgi:hypothetical protein
MVLKEKLDPSSFLAIVCVKIVSMILAIPALISVLKPVQPGVKSKAIQFYMYWKIVTVFVSPLLDAFAVWLSLEMADDH